MKEIKISEYCKIKSYKIAKRLAIILFITSFLFLLSFYLFNEYSKLKSYGGKLNKSFVYWIQSGDTFSIQRAIKSIPKRDNTMVSLEVENQSITFKSDSLHHSLSEKIINSPFFITYDNRSFYIETPIPLVSQSKVRLGKLVLIKEVSLLNILLISLFSALTMFLFSFISSKSLNNYIQEFITPIQILSAKLSDIDSITEFSKVKIERLRFKEANNLLLSLIEMAERIKKSELRSIEIERHKARDEIISQVHHDLESPLQAMNFLVSNASEINEPNKKIAENVLSRIKAISDDLKKGTTCEGKVNNASKIKTSLSTLPEIIESINKIVTEKKLITNFEIRFTNKVKLPSSFFFHCQNTLFQRILSNIINNSLEALSNRSNSFVSIDLKFDEYFLLINIQDNGKGISNEHKKRLFKKGYSFGKKQGQGLGLYHAQKTLSEWGAFITVTSEENKGTTVHLKFPVINKIKKTIVLFEDDPLIETVWRKRALDLNLEFHAVKSYEEFLAISSKISKDSLFFIDSLLSNQVNGKEIAKKLNIQGLTNLYFASGHEHLDDLPAIVKKNVGKTFPVELITQL